jgi:hypothetical protein
MNPNNIRIHLPQTVAIVSSRHDLLCASLVCSLRFYDSRQPKFSFSSLAWINRSIAISTDEMRELCQVLSQVYWLSMKGMDGKDEVCCVREERIWARDEVN